MEENGRKNVDARKLLMGQADIEWARRRRITETM
jgi:hypothetical protein